jgi:heptosyltransferase-2
MKREKILVRGVNWLGDAVMSTPALLRLREARPDAHITILTPDKLIDLWKEHPALDEAIPFAAGESVLNIGVRLRLGNFQAALVLPNSPRSALEVFLGRIPERIGYSRPWRNIFLTKKILPRLQELKMRKRSAAEIKSLIAAGLSPEKTVPASAHHIYQYLHLVAESFGANPEPLAPRLEISSDEIVSVYRRFQISSDLKWLGINAGAEYGPAKRWPRERFLAVAKEILSRPDWGVLFLGGSADTSLVAQMVAELQKTAPENRLRDLSGRTSLRQLCAVMKMCRVVLTNDTGPMHVAAAVGTPVVVPFGSTSPEMTSPGLPAETAHRFLRTKVPCSPCYLRECPIDFRCMRGISIEAVLGAIREISK